MIETTPAGEHEIQLKAREFSSSAMLGDLAAALAKAQGEIHGAKKDADNPFFKSKYADLASVWDACREPLSKNGLAVIQLPGRIENDVFVDSILAHSSGEWICSRIFVRPGYTNKEGEFVSLSDPQAMGSAITYARRYGLQAVTGVAPEDDDGNAASGGQEVIERRQQKREDAAKNAQNAPIETNLPKGKSKPSTTSRQPGEGKDEIPMFNGERHRILAGHLAFGKITPEEFMAIARKKGWIPETAKSFGAMSEQTAAGFCERLEEVIAACEEGKA